MEIFLTAFLIGFSIAAPVGPIGILTIQRSINYGRSAGLATGLGAATADACYGALVGFGLNALQEVLKNIELFLRIGGAAFFIYLGINIFKSNPVNEKKEENRSNNWKLYFSMLFITLTSPATCLIFISVFSNAGFELDQLTVGTISRVVIGVFAGSASWWLLLSFLASQFAHKLNNEHLKNLNRVAALFIFGFAFYGLFSYFL